MFNLFWDGDGDYFLYFTIDGRGRKCSDLIIIIETVSGN